LGEGKGKKKDTHSFPPGEYDASHTGAFFHTCGSARRAERSCTFGLIMPGRRKRIVLKLSVAMTTTGTLWRGMGQPPISVRGEEKGRTARARDG
jgi:hypothetical protein